MPKTIYSPVICLFALLAIASCRTTGTTPAETSYNIFFSPKDHIEQLLSESRLDDASEVYELQADYFKEEPQTEQSALSQFFAKNQGDEPTIVDRLASRLNGSHVPSAVSAKRELDEIAWPTESEKWSRIKKCLIDSGKIINDITEHKILLEEKYRPEILYPLERSLRSIKSSIHNSSDNEFDKYSIFNSPNFFQSFPVELNNKAVFANKLPLINKKLENSNLSNIRKIFNTYKTEMSQEYRLELGKKYYHAIYTKMQKNAFEVLKARAATLSAGMPLASIPNIEFMWVELVDRSANSDQRLDFPVEISDDLGWGVERSSISSLSRESVGNKVDAVFLLEVQNARLNREITSHEKVRSEYRSGTRTDPNPDYELAKVAVTQAQLGVQQAAYRSASTDARYCQGAGCWGKLIAQIANAAAEAAAEEKLQQAMTQLANTPMTIDKPIYSPYSFTKNRLSVKKETSIRLHVFDRLANGYYQKAFAINQEKGFSVIYGLHENERNPEAQRSGTVNESDVVDFEEKPIEWKLSKIIDQLTNSQIDIGKKQLLKTVVGRISKSYEDEIKARKSKKRIFKPRKDDRFDSVVVVVNPKGDFGTGFFVGEDVVLTNNHIIDGGKFAEVLFFDGKETFGKIIATDIRLDLALIKVKEPGKAVDFFSGSELPIGSTVEAIGHPKGLRYSITRGVISALRETESIFLRGGGKVRFVQTDTAISPGNSGGPLFLGREVVGVNAWKLSATEIEGVGFAIHYADVFDFLKKNNVPMP